MLERYRPVKANLQQPRVGDYVDEKYRLDDANAASVQNGKPAAKKPEEGASQAVIVKKDRSNVKTTASYPTVVGYMKKPKNLKPGDDFPSCGLVVRHELEGSPKVHYSGVVGRMHVFLRCRYCSARLRMCHPTIADGFLYFLTPKNGSWHGDDCCFYGTALMPKNRL